MERQSLNPAAATDLTPDERLLLLRIARQSITHYCETKNSMPLDGFDLPEPVRAPRGAFVTLHRDGELRGCIGYIRAAGMLAETVRDNAVNAGFHDPRFESVSKAELPSLTIEISALREGETSGSPFIRVNEVEEVSVGRDGLYLEHTGGMASGILLPQVPLEYGWDVYAFLDALCRKAGVPRGAWKRPDFRLSRFSAEVFSEG
jgi:AmmeMemoRadiSam system protein A